MADKQEPLILLMRHEQAGEEEYRQRGGAKKLHILAIAQREMWKEHAADAIRERNEARAEVERLTAERNVAIAAVRELDPAWEVQWVRAERLESELTTAQGQVRAAREALPSKEDIAFLKSMAFQGPDMLESQERRVQRIIDGCNYTRVQLAALTPDAPAEEARK